MIMICYIVITLLVRFYCFFTFRFYKSKRIVSYQNPPEKEGGIILFKIIKLFFNGVILKNAKSNNNKIFYLPNGTNTDFF